MTKNWDELRARLANALHVLEDGRCTACGDHFQVDVSANYRPIPPPTDTLKTAYRVTNDNRVTSLCLTGTVLTNGAQIRNQRRYCTSQGGVSHWQEATHMSQGPGSGFAIHLEVGEVLERLGIAEILIQLHRIEAQLGAIMSAVSIEQSDLDNLATGLESAVTSINSSEQTLQTLLTTLQGEVAAGNLPQASLDGVNKALTDVQASASALSTLAVPPVTTPPVVEPPVVTPPVDGTPVVDPSVPVDPSTPVVDPNTPVA